MTGRRRPALPRLREAVARRLGAALAVLFALTALGPGVAPTVAGTPLIERVNLYVHLDWGAAASITKNPDVPSGTTFEYVWFDERGERFRETPTTAASVLPLTRAEYGRPLRVEVTATTPGGAAETASSPVVPAVTWAQVDVPSRADGGRAVGIHPKLPATFDADLGPVEVEYRWTRAGTPIAGDPGAEWQHSLVPEDLGKVLQVTFVTRQPATGASSTQVGPPSPPVGTLTMAPTVDGPVVSGGNLWVSSRITSAYPPRDSNDFAVDCTYQWFRNGVAIVGGATRSHHVHSMELGTVLRVRATCSKPGYLTTTTWTPEMRVPGTPALVSFWRDDPVRDLGYFDSWDRTLRFHVGHTGGFDFGPGSGLSTYPTARATALAVAGDLDDDGHEDLVSRDAAGTLYVHGWAAPRVRLGGGWNVMNLLVAGGDFTGDRTADLYARRSTGELVFYAGRARQGIAPGRVVSASGFRTARHIVTTGDANGNGIADLHVVTAAGDLLFYAGRGNGDLAAPVKVGGGWGSMTRLLLARDLNRDGRNDLLALDTAGRLWLYPGNGKGGFGDRTLTNPGIPLSTNIY